MKTIRCIVFSLVLSTGLVFSAGATDVMSKIQTGLEVLDLFLNGLTDKGQTSEGAVEVVSEISETFNIANTVVTALTKKGYTLGEIYYLNLLDQQSEKTLEEIIAARKPGTGWGELAHQLGIHPGDLNKKRVALIKESKARKNKSDNASDDQATQQESGSDDESGQGKAKGKDKTTGQGEGQGQGQGKGKNK
ncbi:MAG: hypothetical protein HYU99_07410 [Deltaproteobacteria bacterium]|nr:hypothetical protein [Deltaproteobacteria bacterium]